MIIYLEKSWKHHHAQCVYMYVESIHIRAQCIVRVLLPKCILFIFFANSIWVWWWLHGWQNAVLCELHLSPSSRMPIKMQCLGGLTSCLSILCLCALLVVKLAPVSLELSVHPVFQMQLCQKCLNRWERRLCFCLFFQCDLRLKGIMHKSRFCREHIASYCIHLWPQSQAKVITSCFSCMFLYFKILLCNGKQSNIVSWISIFVIIIVQGT